MKRVLLPAAILALGSYLVIRGGAAGQTPPVKPQPAGISGTPQPGDDPQVTAEVKDPVPFTSKEGKKGWKVVISGNRPLATPAVVDGKVLVGGGFGSHEFYAFDARTGKKLWVYKTGDDGPTAAAVDNGYIAFNTESCELEIITMAGKRVWKKWLGDPLMSMPAISNGKVYMAYPDSKGDNKHRLACFDVKNGKQEWTKVIPGDIITAPVVADGKVYLTTLEGTLSCYNGQDGKLVFSEKKDASSSPLVANGECYFSRREAVKVTDKDGKQIVQQTEMLAGRGFGQSGGVGGFAGGGGFRTFEDTRRPADYLDSAKRKQMSKVEKNNALADGSVGFATAPAAANLPQALNNLGQLSVAGVWSYQGSRPFLYNGRLISAMGDTVKCLDPKTEKVLWKEQLRDKKDKELLVDSHVTPPAVVNGKIFLGTATGEIVCMSAEDGKLLWRVTVGEPVVFQPAVAGGRVYAATSTGSLYCVETGNARDDGWLMWGGNASHNGLTK